MANESHSSDTDKQTSGVTIGSVMGGIYKSIIAGRDVIFPGGTEQQRAQRNRQAMLELVKNTWVKGVLEQSLHGAAMIELGMEERADAVERPWDMVLQRPDQPNRSLPRGTKMVDVFDEMNRALLILGEPGSGKTTMLLELARQTIAHAEGDPAQPIPVVFNLSSWVEKRQSISDWLVDELNAKYNIPKRVARPWIENDDLLVLLDGLDEVRLEHRNACVKAINGFRREHGLAPIAVCSRVADYEVLTTRLNLQGAILLQPLTPQQIDDYLAAAGAKLSVLRTALRQDAILQELARSPLMLSVMSLVYQDIPAEVLATGQLDSAEARRRHLFAAYVDHMFRRPRADRDYTPGQTVSRLTWLAQEMAEHNQSVFLIEGLQPSWLSTRARRWFYVVSSRLLGGLLIGLSFVLSFIVAGLGGFQDWILSLPGWLGAALVVVLIDGLRFEWRDRHPTPTTPRKLRYWQSASNVVLTGLSAALGFWLASMLVFGLSTDLVLLSQILLVSLVLSGLPFGLVFGLRGRWQSATKDIQTVESLSWSWRRSLQTASAVGVILTGIIFAVTSSMREREASLWDGNGNLITSLRSQADGLRWVSFSPDGSRFVIMSHDGETSPLWDGTDGTRVAALNGHGAFFNADGMRIVTVDSDNTTRLWNGIDGTLIATFEGTAGVGWSASLSPDGSRLATVGPDDTVWLWDGMDGTPIASLKGSTACFNPDGSRILTDGGDGTTWLWNATDGTFITAVRGYTDMGQSSSFSPDGSRLLTANYTGTTSWLWDGTGGRYIAALKGYPVSEWSASFNTDGTRIVTVGGDDTTMLWSGSDGTLIAALEGLPVSDWSASFNADGTRIVTVGSDDTTRLWNAMDGTHIAILNGHPVPESSAGFNAHGTRIVTAGTNGIARLWNGMDGAPVAPLEGHAGAVELVAFSPDGTRIIVTTDSIALLWDGADGAFINTLQGHTRSIESAKFNRDGTLIVTTSYDGTAQLWDGVNGMPVATLQGDLEWIESASFSPDGARIVTTSRKADLRSLSAVGLLLGLVFGLFNGLRGDIRETKTSPNQGISLSARNALVMGTIGGLGVVLISAILTIVATFLLDEFDFSDFRSLFPGFLFLLGLFGGFFSLWYGGLDVIQHFVLRLILCLTGHIPWNYARFLDYAAERIFLRKVGGGYIFVHRLLQEYFATRSVERAS